MSSMALAIPHELTHDTGPWPAEGPIRYGSDAHKQLFCRTLLDSFNPYHPVVLDWPKLEEEAQRRITSLPNWDIAVQTENRAGLNGRTYAEQVADPLLKKAVAFNGFEEKRHRYVQASLVEAYGITLAPEPAYPKPRDAEWSFLVTGYSECIVFFCFRPVRSGASDRLFSPKPGGGVRTGRA